MVTIRTDGEVMRLMGKCVDFVSELIDYIAEYPDDDYMTMECLCRKLVKHGLIDKEDGYYLVDKGIKVAEQTEPQTDCPRCIHFTTDNCRECFNKELFIDSGYITKLNEPKTDCSWK